VVDDVAISVQQVQTDGTTVTVPVASQAAVVTTAGNGNIVLELSGPLTLNDPVTAHGTGNILLASASGLTANADVVTASGHVTVTAVNDVVFTAGADIRTGGTGTINVTGANVTQDGNSLFTTGSGDIRLVAVTNVTLGGLSTGGNVAITATAGSILDGGDTYVNVVANGLRAVAGVGAGQMVNALETTVSVFTARATSGGVHVAETDALVVDDVSVTIRQVQTGGTTLPVVEAAQTSVVTTAGNGNVVLETVGNLTLNDPVTAHGTGNILLATQAGLTANADVSSTGGHITVTAVNDVAFTAGADIRTGGAGTINVTGANLTQADNSLFTTGSGDIRLVAATDVTLGGLSTAGNVAITAGVGSILDGGDTYVDVVANGLRLVAGVGVGQMANGLETVVAVLTAQAAGGGVNVVEADALAVGDVGVTVRAVQGDGTTAGVVAGVQSDVVTTAGNGSIVLRTGGALTLADGSALVNNRAVSAFGTGNILLASAAGLTANADVVATGGHVTVTAVNDVAFTAGADIRTGGTGTINVTGANVTQADNSLLVTGSGDIRLAAAVNVTLGGVSTGGNVAITALAGSILDGGDTYVNVAANGLRAVAGVGVGQMTDALETLVAVFTARAANGGVHVAETDALVIDDVGVTVQQVQANGSTLPVAEAAQTGVVTVAGQGSVVLESGGNLTLNDPVTAHGAGNLLLASAAGLTANADVGSGIGHVTLTAVNDVVFTAGADIRTGGAGTINVTGANLTQADSSLFTGVSGDIRLAAGNNVVLGGVSTAGNVAVTALAGSILDGGDTLVDVVANGLRAVAGTGVGQAANGLETTVAVLTARAGGGGVRVTETDGLVVDDVAVTVQRVRADGTVIAETEAAQTGVQTTGGNGGVLLQAGGSLTVNDPVSAQGAGRLRLAAAAVTVNADLASGSGDATLAATGDVVFTAGADLRTGGAGTISVEAANLTQAATSVVAAGGGDIRLVAGGTVTLGGVGTAGNVAITAMTGSILDGGDTRPDVMAAGARLLAGTGVGQLSDALEVQVTTLTAWAGAGGVSVSELDGLVLDDVGAAVRVVQADGTVVTVTEAAQTGVLTLAGNGSIVVRAAGGLAVNDSVLAQGAGAVRLEAGLDVVVRASAGSSAGPVSVLGATDATVAAGGVVRTGGAGTVDVAALGGSVMMADGAVAQTAGGDLRVWAARHVVLGLLDARTVADRLAGALAEQGSWGRVSVTAAAGSIGEATAAAATGIHIYGAGVRLQAANAVGGFDVREYRLQYSSDLATWTDLAAFLTPDGRLSHVDAMAVSGFRVYRVVLGDDNATAQMIRPEILGGGRVRLTWDRLFVAPFGGLNALETEAATLSVAAGAGGVNVREASGVAVDAVAAAVGRVQVNGTVAPVADLAQADVTAVGGVVLQAQGGGLTLRDGDANGVAVGGAQIRLEAGGDLVAQAAVRSAGAVTLAAGQTVAVAAGVGVRTGSTLNVTGDRITVADGATLAATAGGDIRLVAVRDVVLTGVVTTGNVAVTAVAGSILDGGDSALDVSASGLRLVAGTGVGTLGAGADDALDVSVNLLAAQAAGGGINVLESDTLMVGGVAVGGVEVRGDGTLAPVAETLLTGVQTVAGGGSVVLGTLAGSLGVGAAVGADGGGHVRLAAATSLDLNAAVASVGGALSLLAGTDVRLAAGVRVATGGAGTAEVEAGTGSVVMAGDAVVATGGGDVRVWAAQDLVLGVVDARTAADRAAGSLAGQAVWGVVSLTAAAGRITDAEGAVPGTVNVQGRAARLVAGVAVGEQTPGANPIETEVLTLAVQAGAGGLNLVDRTDVAVGTVAAVGVARVQADGTTATVADAAALTGATKTGGLASIATAIGTPVRDYPGFTVVSTLSDSSRPNSLTGLYEQRVRISNPTGSTIDSVRLRVAGLPAGVTVENAAGYLDGVPYLQYNLPLAAGQVVELVIEYRVPGGGTIPAAPVFLPEVVAPLPPIILTGNQIPDVQVGRTADNRYAVQWLGLSNRTYYVQYSDDGGLTWTTVLSPVIGRGGNYLWLDNGPPKTPTDSNTVPARLYRVYLQR
jgi:hypothetical protein